MPQSLTELVAYLTHNPWLMMANAGKPAERREFVGFHQGRLWTRSARGLRQFVPIGCRKDGDETGLVIDDGGFTVSKFGKAIRFDYAREPAAT